MKAVKLKPLFFPTDDILVRPPEVLCTQLTMNPDKFQNKTVSSLNQLITILRGRKLKKAKTNQPQVEDEKETVKKLNDWKRPNSPNSPLTRKYTFRRTFTLNNLSASMSPEKNNSIDKPKFPLKGKILEALAGRIQMIISKDKIKKKAQEEETKILGERNKEYEEELKGRIERLRRDIKGLKSYIYDSSTKLAAVKSDYELFKKQHEEDSNNLAMLEAQELLFKDKAKRSKPQDEAAYFIKKEKIRKMKQDLHKKFLETDEKFTNEISALVRTIESAEHTRRLNKKQMIEYREEIVMLYCRLLKDGKDARTDGLRWIVKALWTMNEAVPISAFPKFLDDESAHFLLRLSELEIEQQVYSQKLVQIQLDLKKTRPSSCVPSAVSLYSQVKSRLRQISQSSIGRSPVNIKAKDSQEILKMNLTPSSSSEFSVLKGKIAKNQEEIAQITQGEIKRVTDVYLLNPESEEVGLFHVIRCLVGDKVREFNKYTRSSMVIKKPSI